MKLSIVVLTHNRLAALRECLIRIHANTVEADAEIIVVDNGSSDGTGEWVMTQLGLRATLAEESRDTLSTMSGRAFRYIHRETNEGVCARNHALLAAKGKYIAQVDDDVMVMAGWDRILLEPMERDWTIGATGQEGLYQEQSWARTPWSAGLIDDRRKPQAGSFCDFVTGYCWAWRNRGEALYIHEEGLDDRGEPHMVVDEHQYPFRYDERFNPFWHEESDLQLQIRATGYRIMRVRECAIHRSLHAWHNTTANVGPTAMRYAEEHFALLKSKWQNDPRVKYEGALVGLR